MGALLLVSLIPLAQSQDSTLAAASTPSTLPTCIQPRQTSDPPPTSISIALTSAIQNACDTTQQQTVTSSTSSLVYYKFGSFFFNISNPINGVDNQKLDPSSCSASFNSLVSACINAPKPWFWGGWIVSSGTNYSISNSIYPPDPLPSAGAGSKSLASSLLGATTQPSAAKYADSSSATLLKRTLGTVAGPSSALPNTTPPFPIRLSQLSSGGSGGVVKPSGNSGFLSSSASTTPPFPIGSSQASSSGSGGVVITSGNGGFLSSSALRTGGPQSISTVVAPLPLPSLATIITGTVGSQVIIETFVPHLFPQYTTISGTITTTTTLTSGSNPVTVVVGPSGVGWAPYHAPNDAPELLPPSVIPPSAAAAADSVNSAAAGG